MNKKLDVKDFINIGIFVAIYFVCFFASMMIGYIPILINIISLVSGIVCGIPFMLFLTKVKKFGMITIFAVICGLLALFTGSGFYPLTTAIIAGILADLVLKSGGYSSGLKSVLSYTMFCLWIVGYSINTFVITSESYINSLESTYGTEYVSAILSNTPQGVLIIGIVLTIIGGLIGGFLGKKILRKHFVKAGIV